jgi:Glycosyl hydrolases family 31
LAVSIILFSPTLCYLVLVPSYISPCVCHLPPSLSFSLPVQVSMDKSNLNIEGIEHREWHNLYGYYMQQATAEGHILRSPDSSAQMRPFVLTRSFWAGSQRWGAMWTGDNRAEWGHLQIAAPMLLSINLAGLSFAGSDAGGFFGDPSSELFTRWFQAAAFTPFFRGHAHHDTKRREPWVSDMYAMPLTLSSHSSLSSPPILPFPPFFSLFSTQYFLPALFSHSSLSPTTYPPSLSSLTPHSKNVSFLLSFLHQTLQPNTPTSAYFLLIYLMFHF